MISNSFVFFDGARSSEQISNECITGNTSGGIFLTVEGNAPGMVPGSINFKVEVSVDLEAKKQGVDNWFPISVVNMKDFSTTEEITEPGVYFSIYPGSQRVRCKSSAAIDPKLKVYASILE